MPPDYFSATSQRWGHPVYRWVESPAADFFAELRRRFACLPIIAEDLGTITADVRETMQHLGIPGMRVLQFGFSGDPAVNSNAPHLIDENVVAYTGTHNNAPSRGWLEELATAAERACFERYLGCALSGEGIAWEMIRLAMMSRAHLAIIPAQDLLGLGAAARINTPGRMVGNWRWRMTPAQFAALPRRRLRAMTEAFGRSAAPLG